MKAAKTTIGRAVDQPDSAISFYLFYGQDEAQSRALATRLLEGLGAIKFVLAAGAIKANGSLLLDEANAMSLFGGKRAIWIEPATKDIEDAIASLLQSGPTENPVIAIAGTLTKTSPLLKLAEASPAALACVSYVPEGQDAQRTVIDLGRRYGLKISPPVAARIADAAANDQAVMSQELQKLALFVDASPVAPKELDHAALDAVGAEHNECNFMGLGDLALEGDVEGLMAEMDRVAPGTAIPAIRSLQRRLLMLAPARARIERGERVDAVMTSLGKALFWKDKSKVQRMLAKWKAEDLATIAERAGKLERSLMFSKAPERDAIGEEFLAIARKARSL